MIIHNLLSPSYHLLFLGIENVLLNIEIIIKTVHLRLTSGSEIQEVQVKVVRRELDDLQIQLVNDNTAVSSFHSIPNPKLDTKAIKTTRTSEVRRMQDDTNTTTFTNQIPPNQTSNQVHEAWNGMSAVIESIKTLLLD